MVDIAKVCRSPEQVEPPHTVGEELSGDKLPCLPIGETLEQRYRLFCFLVSLCFVSLLLVVLMDIGKFSGMVAGAAKAPTEAPLLKMAVESARSFFGKYSAVTLMAEGKLPDSPMARIMRQPKKR